MLLRGLPVAGRAPVSALIAVLLLRLADEAAVFPMFGTLESFRADLGLTYTQAGTVLAAIGPGAVVGGVFAAAADRWSRRVISAGGAVAFAVSLAMFAAGGSFAVLAAASFLMGMASTAMVDAGEVALVDMAGDDLRRYLARANLLATVGGLLGPALVAAVAVAGLSWRVTFSAAAVLMGLYALLLAAAPLPPPVSNGDGEDEDRPGLGAVVRDPAVWVLGLIGLLMVPFDEPLVGFTIALLEEERGASAGAATVIAFVGVAGGLLAFTVLARRLEAVEDHRLLLWSVTAMAVAALAIAVVPVLAVVAIAGLVAAVGLSLAWLAVQHRILTVRPGQVGTTKAVLTVMESVGMWMPVAIGAIADQAGLTVAVGSYGVLGAAIVLLVAWSGRRDRDRQPA
ncbi:MAG TPA: MFS transporter [Acidimicrobiales bacterium]|nr:MFS transporter [Acidimicrobiales bacterium]